VYFKQRSAALRFLHPGAGVAGFAKIVALQVIDPQIHQHFGDFAGFHELGHGFQAKALGEIEQDLDEQTAVGIVAQVTDKGAVDFDVIDR
jgi:hypothetical protein